MIDQNVMGRFYLYLIISVLAVILTVFLFVRPYKPYDYAKRNANYSEEYIQSLQKTGKKFHTFGKYLMLVVSVTLTILCIIPSVMDLSAMQTGGYKQVTGTVVKTVSSSRREVKEVKIADKETGEEMYLKISLIGQMNEGSEFEFIYLPHTKYASVVR